MVVPARAGMSPGRRWWGGPVCRGPRPRGDEPGGDPTYVKYAKWSPPARG